MEVSRFGRKIAETSGIGQLMEDLSIAYSQGRDILMLGGGNPARIPAVEEHLRAGMEKLLADGETFERAIGNYSPPAGDREFIEAVSRLLRNELGWDIRPENIALTNGSQTAFFILFNIFAGEFDGRVRRKILFPLAPEYIGYCDVGLEEDLFAANKPHIEHIDGHLFKYHVDFDKIDVTSEIGAICVSRPTNPTGNVLTDAEIGRLSGLACENDIPLIIDNAYGMPFPNIIFAEAKAVWNEHTIFCMSLSKLGLPALRTGIVIASEEVISMVAKMNAVMSLAPGGMGAAIVKDLVRTGEIINLSRNVITPYYQEKARTTLEQVYKELDGTDFHVHKPEGAFFLWLWFPNLPITDNELYERLKARGVLIVHGHYFFPGLKEDWRHKNECIRVNYSQDVEIVSAGIKIIAEEVKRAYDAL
jgi:valine--pyruvate aminotransferase